MIQEEEKKICKNCKYFSNKDRHAKGFMVGICDKEPIDMRDMADNNCAVTKGSESRVIFAENFGCVMFEKKV